MNGYLSKKQNGIGKKGAVVHGSVAFIGFLTQGPRAIVRICDQSRDKISHCDFLRLHVGLCCPNYR
jgi:hypothetical protein